MPSLAELTDYSQPNPVDAITIRSLSDVPVSNGNDNTMPAAQAAPADQSTLTQPTLIQPISAEPTPALSDFNTNVGTALDRIVNRLTGSGGEERYQLWPEKVIRSGLSGAHDVYTEGTLPPGLRREDVTDIPPPQMPTNDSTALGKLLNVAPVAASPVDQIIGQAQDMSALAGTGGLAGTTDATLGSAPFLRPALKYGDKIYKAPVGGQHLDALPAHLADEFQRQAMSGEDISNFNFGFMNHKGQFLDREKALEHAINNGLVDPSAGQYGALTSTLMADSSKPGTAIESLAKSNSRKYMEVRKAVEGSDPNYVYHVTNSERADQIAKEGLNIHKPNEYTDQNVWPDGKTEKRNYFTPNSDNSWQFAPEEGKPSLLRIKKNSHDFKKESTGDIYSTKKISPDKIEYLNSDGKWVSLNADSSKPGTAIEAMAKTQPFYSALEHNVNNISQAKMTGDQWLGTLANKTGVKPEEMDWTGVKSFLEERGKQSVTKAELQEHLANNKVELKEVDKGVKDPEAVAAFENYNKELASKYGIPEGQNVSMYASLKNIPKDEITKYRELQEAAVGNKSDTKYHSYQLPGGENYREKLLTLPSRNSEMKELEQKLSQWKVRPETALAHAHLMNRWRELDSANYKSSHWDEPNILAHVRMNDRTIPVEFTAEEKAALAAHENAQPKLDAIRKEQGEVAKDISFNSRSLEYDRQAKIRADMESGKISKVTARKQMEDYVSHPELRPLQDKLEALRSEEDALRKSLPEKPTPKSVKSLHLEEIQSDMMQAGRGKGFKSGFHPEDFDIKELPDKKGFELRYKGNPDQFGKKENFLIDTFKTKGDANAFIRNGEIPERLGNVLSKEGMRRGEIPDAPFEKNWHELALKRMIREAAEKGYDRLSWTPGEAQALRYPNELRKAANSIEWHNKSMGKVDPSGSKQLLIDTKNGDMSLSINKDGVITSGPEGYKTKHLSEVIGKEMANDILNKNEGHIAGKDFVIGGEGMKGFYDQIVPKSLERITGQKVKEGEINTGDPKNKTGWETTGNIANSPPAKVKYIDLTPELKDKALSKGFPLFSGNYMYSPVVGNPFDASKQK